MGEASTSGDMAEEIQDQDTGITFGFHQSTEDRDASAVQLQFRQMNMADSGGPATGDKVEVLEGEWTSVSIKGLTLVQAGSTSSWANQVEEEHEPVGWTGQPRMNPLNEGKSPAKNSRKKKGRERAGGSKLAQQGGPMDESRNPSKTISPLAKGQKGPQSKAAGGTIQHPHGNNGGEYAAGAPVQDNGNGVQSGSPAHSQSNPMAAWPPLGTSRSRQGEDQPRKTDADPIVAASPSGWDLGPAPTFTDGWDSLVEGREEQPHAEGKWIPLDTRNSGKVSGGMDSSGRFKVTGNSLRPPVSHPQNGRALPDCPSDEGWETVPKRKQKGPSAQRDSQLLQTLKGKPMNEKIQDGSRNLRIWGRAIGDLEINGRKLGGSSKPASPKEETRRGSDMSMGKGWLKVPPYSQRDLAVSGTPLSSDKNPDMGVWGDLKDMSRGETSESGAKADSTNQCLSQAKQVEEIVEQPGDASGIATSSGTSIGPVLETDGDGYPVCSDTDSQSYDLEDVEDETDEDYMSEDCDSDESEKSHETQKKAKWFHSFFQDLNGLTEEQLQEHDRQWHCPVCKGGVGGIDWFRGLGPLVTHARTNRSRRVKLHRTFAEILEEEMRVRGTGAGSGGQPSAQGKWKGLQNDDEAQNPLIIWPPMVVIQNTKLEQDNDEKWLGMGNKELLDYFKEYNPMKPRHAYGPQGHRGMSLLLFEQSPSGYHDAQRLDKHFKDARRSREDWNRPSRLLYLPGGNGSRILYGYLATKEDIEVFNRHSKGKSVIKYDFKRLQEVVLEPMRLMHDQNQKVLHLQTTVEKAKEVSKTLKKTVTVVARNLQLREKELQVLRKRAEEQIVRNKQQQNDMEEFFRIERKQLEDEVIQKEAELETLRGEFKEAHLQQRRKWEMKQSKIPKIKGLSKDEQHHQQALMEKEIARETQLVEGSISDAQAYESQRIELQQKHHDLRTKLREEQHKAVIALETQLQAEMAELMRTFQTKWQC